MKGFGSERWKTSFRFISSGLGLNYWLFLWNIVYFVGQICNASESKTSIIEQSSLEETMCKNASECNFIRGPVTCEHNLCVCKHNYVFNKHKNKCLPRKALGELCEISEQCNMSDPYSYCYTLAALDPKPVNCRCRAGYQEVGADGENKKCKKVLYNSGGSFFDGISPYDARDLVPIIMGCLAAGLALCFCCVGIVQLMRYFRRLLEKRKRSLQWRTECEIPQEFLFAGSDVTHYVTTNTTGLPGPETLTDLNDFENEERYQIVDLPPSYEAAIIPPSYEEAMKRVKASESNL